MSKKQKNKKQNKKTLNPNKHTRRHAFGDGFQPRRAIFAYCSPRCPASWTSSASLAAASNKQKSRAWAENHHQNRVVANKKNKNQQQNGKNNFDDTFCENLENVENEKFVVGEKYCFGNF